MSKCEAVWKHILETEETYMLFLMYGDRWKHTILTLLKANIPYLTEEWQENLRH